MNSNERWISGYEGRYTVDTEGQVRSYKKNGNIHLIGSQHPSGYIHVNLTDKEGNKAYNLVHRLVAQAFLPNTEGLPQVDHKDENKANNTVSNLRWCTHQQNMKYYNTTAGRDYHKKLREEFEARMRDLKNEVLEEKKEVKRLLKELGKAKEALEKQGQEFSKYVQKESIRLQNSNKSYDGYKDVVGMKFISKEDMIKATGKGITVSGQEFISCGSAAQYIVDQEALEERTRNKATVSKELRRFLQGKRLAWTMYDRYTIGT